VTQLSVPTQKKLVLLAGRSYPELAQEVADNLGIPLSPTLAYDFANGEIFVRFQESVRGTDAFVLQSHTTPINKWIMEQLIMIDALKRASAKRITVIVPFYGYARQDKKHRGREPISARLIADLFKTAGADRLMTVDLHTSQIQGFFDGPVDHLFAMPLLAKHVASRVPREDITVRMPAACAWPSAGPTSSVPRSRSSTSGAIQTSPIRSACSRSSVTCAGASASWSTT
jgi:ribose-phosphate pyrophosphokinase